MLEIATLVDIACAAGEKVLEIYAGDFDVAFKADNSPVTLADTAAEAIITPRLNAAFAGIPVVAEEAVSAGVVPETDARFFLVDPLDGSKEFIARNGEFTVNIALIDNGQPIAGVVYAPAIGRIWWGAHGQGSFMAKVVDADTPSARIIEQSRIEVRLAGDGLCAVGSRSHGSGEGDPRLAGLAISDFRSAGSSLKFCLVAAGEADIYPRFGRTMEWDTAAGDAILRAAGGRVTCLDGSPLAYGKRNQAHDSDFANPFFFAFGDPRLSELVATTDQRAS